MHNVLKLKIKTNLANGFPAVFGKANIPGDVIKAFDFLIRIYPTK